MPPMKAMSDLSSGIIDLLSNNSELGLTPDRLRKLAEPQGSQRPSGEPTKFQIHRLSARLGPDLIEDAVRRYEVGESARSLASELQIAPSALLRLLRERNVVVRARFVTPEQEKEMARCYDAGMTMVELEVNHGFSHNAVLRALRRAGVDMRGKGRRKRSERSAAEVVVRPTPTCQGELGPVAQSKSAV